MPLISGCELFPKYGYCCLDMLGESEIGDECCDTYRSEDKGVTAGFQLVGFLIFLGAKFFK